MSTNYLSVVRKSRSTAAHCQQTPFGSPEMRMGSSSGNVNRKAFQLLGNATLLVQIQSSAFQPPRNASVAVCHVNDRVGFLTHPNIGACCLALAVPLGELGTLLSVPPSFFREREPISGLISNGTHLVNSFNFLMGF